MEDWLDELATSMIMIQKCMLKRGLFNDNEGTDEDGPRCCQRDESLPKTLTNKGSRPNAGSAGKTHTNNVSVSKSFANKEPANNLQTHRHKEGNNMQPALVQGNSETTVYCNAIECVSVDNPNLIDLDENKLQQNKHFSSSDDDIVDTSDELITDFDVTEHDAVEHAHDAQLGTSRGGNQERDCSYHIPQVDPAVTRAEQMIRDAEVSKAQILATPGNDALMIPQNVN